MACPVCMSYMIEPCTTQCGHSFCRPCLAKSIECNSLSCPVCRAEIQGLPELNLALREAHMKLDTLQFCERAVELIASKNQELKKLQDKNSMFEESITVSLRGSTTPLHVLAQLGEISTLKYFLRRMNVDVDTKDKRGYTPFMSASSIDVMETLLEYGARINAKNNMGETTLMKRVYNKEFIPFLLENGADINIVPKNKKPFIFRYLDTFQYAKEDVSLLDTFIDYGLDVNIKNKRGQTPLMICLFYNKRNYVESLIINGADPLIKDEGGYLAIDYVENKESNTWFEEVLCS